MGRGFINSNFGGAHFLKYAEGRSQREITKLLDLNPTSARRYKPDGSIEIVDVDDLRIDDRVQVLNGDQVPIDGVVLEGQTTINEASISGESMPQDKKPGDQVYGSTINGSGTIIIEVTKESKDTVFGRIMSLSKKIKVIELGQQLLLKNMNLIMLLLFYWVL